MRYKLLLILLFTTTLACEQVEKLPSGTPVAKVGNAVLHEEDLLELYPEGFSQDQKNVLKQQLVENWIKEQLLIQEAIRTRLAERADVLKRMEKARQEVLAQAMRESWLKNMDSLNVSKVEAQTFYEKNKTQFVLQERHVRFRHIQTADLESSRNAKSELLRGIPFNTVVERYALEKTATITNSETFQPISVAIAGLPEMNRYLQVMGINEISPIRLLDGRYHFVQLTEERAAGEHPDMDWILGRITDWLLLEKKRKIIQSLERELYLKAEISNEITLYPTQ